MSGVNGFLDSVHSGIKIFSEITAGMDHLSNAVDKSSDKFHRFIDTTVVGSLEEAARRIHAIFPFMPAPDKTPQVAVNDAFDRIRMATEAFQNRHHAGVLGQANASNFPDSPEMRAYTQKIQEAADRQKTLTAAVESAKTPLDLVAAAARNAASMLNILSTLSTIPRVTPTPGVNGPIWKPPGAGAKISHSATNRTASVNVHAPITIHASGSDHDFGQKLADHAESIAEHVRRAMDNHTQRSIAV